MEDKNFALFNYVNELNNQIEALQEQIEEIRKDIRRFEGQGTELEEKHRKMVEELEEKRSQAAALADEYEEKTRSAKKILDQCRAGKHPLKIFSIGMSFSFKESIQCSKKLDVIVDKSITCYRVMME